MLAIKFQAFANGLIERSIVIPGICVNEDWSVLMVFTERVQQRNELHIDNNVVGLGMLEDVLDVIFFETRYCKLDKMVLPNLGDRVFTYSYAPVSSKLTALWATLLV